MSKSAMERLRSGECIEIPLGEYGFSVQVDAKAVWVHGCDCASSADVAEAQAIHEALGAWLRVQKGTT